MRRKHYSEGSSIRRSDPPSALFEDDMEEELEKTKVVKAFWDLRQEVRKNFVNRCSIFFNSSLLCRVVVFFIDSTVSVVQNCHRRFTIC